MSEIYRITSICEHKNIPRMFCWKQNVMYICTENYKMLSLFDIVATMWCL